MSITHGYSGSEARALGGYTPEYFNGLPRFATEPEKNKKIDRAVKAAGDVAHTYAREQLDLARLIVTESIYRHVTGSCDVEDADEALDQAIGMYANQLGATILNGVDRSRRNVNVRTPVAIGKIGTQIMETETIDRLRTIDGSFMPAVLEAHKQLPRLSRIFRNARFIATYPDRPSDVLLKGHDRIDTGAAQVQYGVWAGAEFGEVYGGIESEYDAADCRAGVVPVLKAMITRSVGNERHATYQAYNDVLGK